MNTNTNANTYNPAVPGQAPVSTRVESHIPGTEAHRERKFEEVQAGYGNAQPAGTGYGNAQQAGTGYGNAQQAGTGYGNAQPAGTGYQGANTAPTDPSFANNTAAAPGNTGYNTTGAPIVPASGHTTESYSRNPADKIVPRGHMGDKMMGKVEAGIGRMTNNPEREIAGLERQTYGDPKHWKGTARDPGTTAQPAQQAYTQPQQPPPTQPGF